MVIFSGIEVELLVFIFLRYFQFFSSSFKSKLIFYGSRFQNFTDVTFVSINLSCRTVKEVVFLLNFQELHLINIYSPSTNCFIL